MKNIIKFILVILLFLSGGSLLVLFLKGVGFNLKAFDVLDYNYLECITYMLFALIVFLLYRKYFKADYKEFKNGFKSYLEIIIKYTVLFFIIKIGCAVLTEIIGLIIGANIGESANQESINALVKASPIVMLITITFLGPIVEEGIFRLGLRKVIKNKYVFLTLTGLMFGLMHIFPTNMHLDVALTYSIIYVMMGIYLGYVYEETDNIWVPIIIHSLNNFISFILIITIL